MMMPCKNYDTNYVVCIQLKRDILKLKYNAKLTCLRHCWELWAARNCLCLDTHKQSSSTNTHRQTTHKAQPTHSTSDDEPNTDRQCQTPLHERTDKMLYNITHGQTPTILHHVVQLVVQQ